MSLKQALESKPVDPRRKCGLAEWLKTLPVDERELARILLEQLADGQRTVAFVTAAFVGEGFSRGTNVVSRHKNGGCSCVVSG